MKKERDVVRTICIIVLAVTMGFIAQAEDQLALADPFVFVENGVYYAYGTSAKDGIEVAVSTDLCRWTRLVGRSVGGLALHKDDSFGEKWFWAPEVYRRADGRYVMFYSAEERTCAAVSDSPLGPFVQSSKRPLIDGKVNIDNTLVYDVDGTPWMFHVQRHRRGNEIWRAKLTSDLLSVVPGTEQFVLRAEEPWESQSKWTAEGPSVVKREGRWYLIYSANDFQNPDYAVGFAVAEKLCGPWVKPTGANPILRRTGGMTGVGHGAPFVDNDGRWRYVFHAHDKDTHLRPRRMYVTDLAIDGNGNLKAAQHGVVACRMEETPTVAWSYPPRAWPCWERLRARAQNYATGMYAGYPYGIVDALQHATFRDAQGRVFGVSGAAHGGVPCVKGVGFEVLDESEEWMSASIFKVKKGPERWVKCDVFMGTEDTPPHRMEFPSVKGFPSVDDGLYDAGRETVAYICCRSKKRPTLYVGESRVEALNDDLQWLEQSCWMEPSGTDSVWRTTVSLAFRYYRFADVVEETWFETDEMIRPLKYNFDSENSRLVKIWRASAETIRLTSRRFFVDAVKRDRLPWAGDYAITFLADAATYCNPEAARFSLDSLSCSRYDGLVDYQAWWVILNGLYRRVYGDLEYCASRWDIIRQRTDQLLEDVDEYGLKPIGGMIFIDWGERGNPTTAYNILRFGALASSVSLARELGHIEDARRWQECAERLKKALLAKSYDSQRGLFRTDVYSKNGSFLRHANILAILFGIVDTPQTERIGKELAKNNMPPVGSTWMIGLENLALQICGHSNVVLKRIDACWGGMLDRGFNTQFEHWWSEAKGADAYRYYERPFGLSLCHATAASPAFLLPRIKNADRTNPFDFSRACAETGKGKNVGEIAGTSLKWSLSRYAKIEGDILTVEVPAGCAKEGGHAIAWVDLSSIDGQCFSASVRCRGENVSKPDESWNGLKFQFEFRNLTTGEMMYPNTKSRLGTFPEETIQTTVADAGGRLEKVKLTLGLQSSSGKVVFDLSTLKISSGCDIYPRVNGEYRVRYPECVKSLPQQKGVMLPAGPCKEDDFRTLKEWGATLARYQMVRNWNEKNTDRELDEYMQWLDGKLDHLDRKVLPWAEKYGVRIVVDLHVPPGGKNGGDMNMFYERKYNDAFVDCWRKIARRFKGRKAIYGYDLINEPQQTDKAVCDYWNTQRRAAEAVREIDSDVTIVMESNGWDSPGTYSYLSPLAMDNVIYQVHMYEPFVFTHQGVHPGYGRVTYPDETKGWNRAYLEKRLAPVREFQKKHDARIYVGEFSAAAWAPGAERYLADVISLFNEYGWDWTYHSFREWPGWSVEHEGTGPSDMKPSADTPRKRVLLRSLR